MEEKRPGQDPLGEQRAPGDPAAGKRDPGPADAPQTARERAMIDAAQEQGAKDRAAMRAAGFGDHKGSEGA